MRRWDETTGNVSVFRNPSNHSNGNTRDRQGRLVTCEHLTRRVTGEGLDGVRVYAPDGDLIGHISLPERCANICFGGRKRNQLFMVASHSLYALFVGTQGLPGG